MAIRARVRDDDNYVGAVTCNKQNYLIIPTKKGKFRVYEDAGYYSQNSGGVTVRGKVIRDLNDQPIDFNTIEAAEKWVKDGMVLFANGRDADIPLG